MTRAEVKPLRVGKTIAEKVGTASTPNPWTRLQRLHLFVFFLLDYVPNLELMMMTKDFRS